MADMTVTAFMFSSTVLHRKSCMLLLMAIVAALVPGSTFGTEILKVYTWPDYMDPDVVSRFESRFDAQVQFSYFASDEARDRELAYSNGRGFDVMTINRLQVSRYAERGWLQTLDTEQMPDLRHIDRRWGDALGLYRDHAAAYFWGSLGIAYRQDLVEDAPVDWKTLLNPPEELRRRIVMPSHTRELIAISLKSQGLSANSGDEQLIIDAGNRLLEQKPGVLQYGYPTLDKSADLVSGKVRAGAYYNGDILRLQNYNSDIVFVNPEEGSILWVDYLAIADTSENAALARAFINFLHTPEIAAQQARFLSLATPNAAARALLPSTHLENPAIYPSRRLLQKSEFLQALPPRSQKQVNIIGAHLSD